MEYSTYKTGLVWAVLFAENVAPVHEKLWGEKKENRRQMWKINITLLLF